MSKAVARATTRPAKPEGKVRVTQPERTAEFAALFGDPQIAMEDMRRFSHSTSVFESDYYRLLDEYEGRWIAMHDGEVIANASTLDLLIGRVESEQPEKRRNLFARFMEREPQLLIL